MIFFNLKKFKLNETRYLYRGENMFQFKKSVLGAEFVASDKTNCEIYNFLQKLTLSSYWQNPLVLWCFFFIKVEK